MGRSGIWIVNLQTERVRQLTTGLFDRPSVVTKREADRLCASAGVGTRTV